MPVKPVATPQDKKASHVVAFFDRDDFLIDQLSGFVADGHRRGERVVIIARADHVSRLRTVLRERGLDPTTWPDGAFVALDAEHAIDAIVVDGVFVPQRLSELLLPLMADRACRIFGEMVSVLAERGQLQCALELESAGRDLAHRLGTPVLCAYDAQHLGGNDGHDHRAMIEEMHDDVHDERARMTSPTGEQARTPPVVLLADDFDDAREMYAEYLQFAGIDVVTAASGEEAIRLAIDRRPDLILMDIRMPGMTGTKAMRTLREHPDFRPVPIIALTAHALHEERAGILAEGFDAILSKPCLPDELLAEVRKSLGNPDLT